MDRTTAAWCAAALMVVATLHGIARWVEPPEVGGAGLAGHAGERVRFHAAVKAVAPAGSRLRLDALVDGAPVAVLLPRGHTGAGLVPGARVEVTATIGIDAGRVTAFAERVRPVDVATRAEPAAAVLVSPHRVGERVTIGGNVSVDGARWRLGDADASILLGGEPPARPGAALATGIVAWLPARGELRLDVEAWRAWTPAS